MARKIAKVEIISGDKEYNIMPGKVELVEEPTIASNMIAVIKRASSNPRIDIIKMQSLLDMQKEIIADQRQQQFAIDFVKMKPHLPRVIKTKANTQTKSKYAPLEDINAVIDPILEQFGFGTSFKIISNDIDGVRGVAKLWHRGGFVEECPIWMPLDNKGSQGTVNKTGPHATSSSIMYARRSATCALLNISTGDDMDGNTDNPIKPPEDDFNKRVQEEANQKQKFVEPDKEQWDGTINIKGNQIIISNDIEFGARLVQAAIILMEGLKDIPLKEERIKVINQNLLLIKAMAENKMDKTIDKFHKFADEGQP